MARYLFSQGCFLSAIYCGGYSGEDPPLPIPNREVKLTIADGTAPPGGRVGSCRSSGLRSTHVDRSLFLCPIVQSLTPKGKMVRKLTLRTTSPFGCTSPAHPGLHRRWPLVNYFQDTGRATSTPRRLQQWGRWKNSLGTFPKNRSPTIFCGEGLPCRIPPSPRRQAIGP